MKQPIQLELFSIPALVIDEAFGLEMTATILKHFQDRKSLITHAVIHPDTLSKHIPNMQDHRTWHFSVPDVNINRKRMKTFSRSKACSCCGLVGNVYVIEEAVNDVHGRKYLNLYHVSEHKVVEMTVDHTLPQSLAGADTQHNRETMCFKCNQKKANVMGRKEIEKVLHNVKRYTKEWANVEYLTALLKLHLLMLDQTNPNTSRQLKGALNKYVYVMQPGTKAKTYEKMYKQLTEHIDSLTEQSAPEPVVVKSSWFDNIVLYVRKLLGK